MAGDGRQSLVNRMGLTLGAVLLLATLNMLGSFLIAENLENDAVRIDLAGSLRMQSYRIAGGLLSEDRADIDENDPSMLEDRIVEFDERFYQPVLNTYLRNVDDKELAGKYLKLEESWSDLKIKLRQTEPDLDTLLLDIDTFVVEVDVLVGHLAVRTESKFKLLRLFQGLSLLLTIVIVALGYFDLTANVVAPLKKLVVIANRVQEGDFSERIKVEGNDELSLLAGTFNQMSEGLEAMYQDLEEKIRDKTEHLEHARDELAVLYLISRILSSDNSLNERVTKALDHINSYIQPAKASLDVVNVNADLRLDVAVASMECKDAPTSQFNIERQGNLYGRLIVCAKQSLAEVPLSLLQAVADNLAAALDADQRHDQHHRLILMEERAVIARELHDSLAQSLSYLKIQFSRMQMLKAKGDNNSELDATMIHIKTGIDAAYQQLRELLATFRLQLSNEGLKSALEKTVSEFSDRSDILITLNYPDAHLPITPNEEIHVLQIVRESLSNVVRHSGAANCEIGLAVTEHGEIRVIVEDDGIGFSSKVAGADHFGKVIMRERANVLGGNISFYDNKPRGAIVELVFWSSVQNLPQKALELVS